MRASFCSLCPARLGFPLFFPVFSLPAGHHSSFSSPMPRPEQLFSLLPCFFSAGGAPQASFCSLCPAQLGFSLFFPAFSLTAGHHRIPFAPCAPPGSDFLSSSLFFLCRRGTTALFLLPCPARDALQPGPQPHSHKNSDGSCLSADFRFHVFHMPARSFRQNTVSKSSPSSIAS